MPEKELTRVQAWERLKIAFQNPPVSGTPGARGLCHATLKLLDLGEISFHTYIDMEYDIQSVEPKRNTAAWFWPIDAKGSKCRVRAINKILKRLAK